MGTLEFEVVDYDPNWASAFEGLRALIADTLGEIAISIEHVGSTSVPGLAAKPVIDVDVVVAVGDLGRAIQRLVFLGYAHLGDLGIPQREAFRPPKSSIAHHLYVCPVQSPALANHVAVRDYLRANPAAARGYGELKKRLAREYAGDIGRYTEAKTPFLIAILRKVGFPKDALLEK